MILLFCSVQGIIFQLDMYRSSILFCEIGMPVVTCTHFIIISYTVCTEKSLVVLSQVLMVYMRGADIHRHFRESLVAHKAKFVLAELSVTRGGVWG